MTEIVRLTGFFSKYLILFFMVLYTFSCYVYFTADSRKKRNRNLNFQVFYIFMIHAISHICLYINIKETYVLLCYLVEIFIAVMYIITFRLVYKNSSRLLTNNVAFLMLIGYTMLLRLSSKYAIKQFILASVALLITIFIPAIMMKLKGMRTWRNLYAIGGIAFLLTVFIPGLGVSRYGSRNWISIGDIVSLQPMEFVKIVFILFVASSLVKMKDYKSLLLNAAVAGIFMLILAAEKDFGALMLFYICYFLMVYVATSRILIPIAGVLFAVIGCVLGYMLFKDTLFAHVMVRVSSWINPFADQQGTGYQLSESLYAISSGGLFGSGLGQGMPYMIPVAESDFIFSAICEELGLLFGICLILVYISSFISMQMIAIRCKDPFYKYVTYGIAIVYIFQVLLNIGGAVKFIPSTGVTLPLVSYGVSSVFSTLIMFAMIQFTYMYTVNDEKRTMERREELKNRRIEEAVENVITATEQQP